jgi:hypothetical protein
MVSLNLYSAHKQWASRPADERFWNLQDLHDSLQVARNASVERDVPLAGMRAVAHDDDVCLMGSRAPAQLSNYSFVQLCMKADSPAGYLQRLPVNMAVDCLNWGLQQRQAIDQSEQVKLLLHRNGDWLIRSIQSPNYGRIWNVDIVSQLLKVVGDSWIVPPARPAVNDPRARPATAADILPNQGNFGLSVGVGDMIAPAGVYCGDRDMFVFLVNPNRIIDDGQKGLMRGVFIWNSEVGAGAFKVRTFMLENVCGNHICWGASNVQDFRIIHKKGAIHGFGDRMLESLQSYADSDSTSDEVRIRIARTHVLGKDKAETVALLANMKKLLLSKRDVEGAYVVAEQWEHTAGSPPNTAWGFAHGLTRYSQQMPFADERHKLDIAAAKILSLAV